MSTYRVWAAPILVVFLLMGCGRGDPAWEQAKTVDTPDAYAEYQERHPRSPHSAAARERREALLAERDWSTAKQTHTVESYQRYIEQHPEGLWVGLAKERIVVLARSVEPSVEPSIEPSIELPVEPSVAQDLPLQPAVVAPQIFVQLGAFSSQQAAERAWRNAEQKVGALAELEPSIVRSAGGSRLYLLRVGLTDTAAARDLCAAAARVGQACIVDPS